MPRDRLENLYGYYTGVDWSAYGRFSTVAPTKPDYELVTDEILESLIFEHVKPWFSRQTEHKLELPSKFIRKDE